MASEIAGSLDEVVAGLLEDCNKPVLVVGPSTETIAAVIEAGTNDHGLPAVRVLATHEVLAGIRDRFSLASRAADLVVADRLAFRELVESVRVQCVSTASMTAMVMTAGTHALGLSTDSSSVRFVDEYYSEMWAASEGFSLRTPSLSRMRGTLRDVFGEGFVADFDAAFDALAALEDSLDVIALMIVLAAKHEELLYDIGNWGEDVGLSSRATYSRTKTTLEELGVIATEKVPVEVGRPRLRLTLRAPALREASPAEIPRVLLELLE